MNMMDGISISQLVDELLAMPEQGLYDDLQSLNISIYIFDKNFDNLEELILFLTTDPRADSIIWEQNRQEDLQTLQLDVIRRLYNFVQSAMALVDHTRILYRKLYPNSEVFSEYQGRVNRDFANDPLSRFVQDLRVYCHHYKAPNIAVRVSVTPGPEGSIERKTVEISLKDLEIFDGWTSLSKKYLRTIQESMDVLKVLSEYKTKVMEFYKWFQACQIEIHKDEFELYRDKQRQIFLLMLERNIEGCFQNKDNMPFRGEEIFHMIFKPKDFEEISKIPAETPNRVQRAIELAEMHFAIPKEVRQKLILLYQEPGFFAPKPDRDQ
jgi:hypothetical protein